MHFPLFDETGSHFMKPELFLSIVIVDTRRDQNLVVLFFNSVVTLI